MSSGFGGSIKLTGESDYRKALKNIQQGLREVSSAMKVQTQSFNSASKSTSALATTNKELADKLKEQKRGVDALRASIAQMEAEQKKQASETQRLASEYDKEKSKLEQLANTLGTSSKEYQEQVQVVDKLEQELTQSQKAEDNMSTSLSKMRTQANNAEASILKNENALDKMNKELNEAQTEEKETGNQAQVMGNKLEHAGNQGKKSSEGFTIMKGALANLASKGIGIAITAVKDLAKATITASTDFERGMSKVIAISGATGSDVDKLKKKAKEMGSTTQFTATQSAEAFQYMAMAGWKTNDMLKGIKGVMNLASASGEDLATTSDIVTDAITAFGLKAKDSAHFSDVLAVASSNANTNVGMMGETFKYVAPVAGSLGFKVEDVAEGIGLMANSGIKASQAGTSLRSIFTRLSTDAGASSKSLGALGILTKKLGVEFYDAQGKVRPLNDIINESRTAWKNLSQEEQSNYAKKIAGQNAISGWNALMNASAKDVEKLNSALKNADGTAEKMSDTMLDNLGGDVTKLSSAFEGLQLAVSEGANGSMRELVQYLTKSVVPSLQGLMTGAKGASEQFSKAISGLLQKALKQLTSALPSVVKIGSEIVLDLAEGIVKELPTMISTITQTFNELVKTVTDRIPKLLDSIPVDGIVDGFVNLLMCITDAMPIFMEKVTPKLGELVIKLGVALLKNSPKFLGSMVKLWLTMPVAMGKAVVETVKAIPGAVKKITGIWGSLKEGMNKIWEGIKTRWNAIPSDIRGIFVNAYDKIKGIFEDLPGFFGDIWDKVKSKAKSFGIAIGGAISGAVKGVINGVISTIEKSINGAISLINGALGIINKIPKVDIPLLKKLNLPKLARGGIVSSPTLAEVGEAGREAIVPLENNKGWIKELANELNKSMLTPLNTTRTRTAEQQKLNDYNNLVSAFKTALTGVKVELDDDEVGSFVTKTVSNAIYS